MLLAVERPYNLVFPCRKHARGTIFCYTNRACQLIGIVLSDAKDAPTQNGESPSAEGTENKLLETGTKNLRYVGLSALLEDGDLAPFHGKALPNTCSSITNRSGVDI